MRLNFHGNFSVLVFIKDIYVTQNKKDLVSTNSGIIVFYVLCQYPGIEIKVEKLLVFFFKRRCSLPASEIIKLWDVNHTKSSLEISKIFDRLPGSSKWPVIRQVRNYLHEWEWSP